MALIELTEDEIYWIAVAIENSLESARRIAESDNLDDQLDAGSLIHHYTQLQEKFPTPEIGLKGE